MRCGAPKWDEADYQLAREFINSYDEETTAVVHQKIRKKYGADHLEEVLRHPLSTQVEPFDSSRLLLESGSTDVGDVGFATPTMNLNVACACICNVGHTWQMTAQACSSIAHKGLLTAGKVLALAAIEPSTVTRSSPLPKPRFWSATVENTTVPLPDSVQPPLDTYSKIILLFQHQKTAPTDGFPIGRCGFLFGYRRCNRRYMPESRVIFHDAIQRLWLCI